MTQGQDTPTQAAPSTAKARYVMIGGFLGAGKTTAVGRLAQDISGRGLRVGLITNDQGSNLVDTASLAARGFPVKEIAGGCFCCRFASLADAAKHLAEEARPDVFVAEPVGSCTDLVATVAYPLRRMYGGQFSIAPLSVLVDPVRALRVLELEDGPKFSSKVAYIYRKQLEEADLIVVNKCDALDASRLSTLRRALAERFPRAELFEVSARHGDGLRAWFDRIFAADQVRKPVTAVDYQMYGEGEALLGWLNATFDAELDRGFDGNALLQRLAGGLHQELNRADAEIAHLKMTLDPSSGWGDLAVINLVRNDWVPELSQELESDAVRAQGVVNLRAEASPEVLRQALDRALDTVRAAMPGLRLSLDHLEHFRPGQPVPTHRDVD